MPLPRMRSGRQQAQAARTSSIQPLSIPVPPFEFRSETAHIESALNALHQIDYVLEVGMSDEGDSGIPLDIDMTQTLVWAVQEHARYLANESPSATSSTGQPPRRCGRSLYGGRRTVVPRPFAADRDRHPAAGRVAIWVPMSKS